MKKFRIKDGFLLKEIAGNYIIVALNEDVVDTAAMININDSGAFLFGLLAEEKTKEELKDALMKEYDGVSAQVAESDISDFIGMLEKKRNVGYG